MLESNWDFIRVHFFLFVPYRNYLISSDPFTVTTIWNYTYFPIKMMCWIIVWRLYTCKVKLFVLLTFIMFIHLEADTCKLQEHECSIRKRVYRQYNSTPLSCLFSVFNFWYSTTSMTSKIHCRQDSFRHIQGHRGDHWQLIWQTFH